MNNKMYEFHANSLGIADGRFLFNNGFPLRTFKSIEVRDIIFKTICVPRKCNIPVMDNFCGLILIGCFENLRERHNTNLSPM